MDGDDSGGSTPLPVSSSAASLEDMDAGIVIPEDNLVEQKDEVLAIQSIYDDGEEQRITVVSEPDEEGHGLFRLEVKIPVATPSEECEVDLMLPTSESSSPSQSGEQSPMGAEGGEGVGAQNLEEGAKALTPPPEMGKGVALQRSVSGQRWTGSLRLRHLHPVTLHLTLPPNYPSEAAPAFMLSCVWLRGVQISTLCRQLDAMWEAAPSMPVLFSWIDWLENESFSFLGLTDKLVLMPDAEDDTADGVDDRAMSECDDIGLAVHTLLQYDNQREAVEFCKSIQECCLCFDEKPGTKFFRLEQCKHHFCSDCITTHCNLHVTDGTIQYLKCPDLECKTMIPPDVLQMVLTPDNFIRWESLSLQRSLDEMDDVVYCPRCQSVVIREQDADLNLAYCMACCYSFCTDCEQPWHQGTECTSDLERLEAQAGRIQQKDVRARERFELLRRQAEEKSKSIQEIKSKSVNCPHCKIPVEKIEGCNKMTCRCGKHFCWLCGKGINGYDHFTSSTCVLFRYQPAPVPRVIYHRRPPDALLWMQAQAELQGGGGQSMRCIQCKQTNYKLNRNNHIRCWNCKVNLCYYCRTRLTGVVTHHFTAGGCPQHS